MLYPGKVEKRAEPTTNETKQEKECTVGARTRSIKRDKLVNTALIPREGRVTHIQLELNHARSPGWRSSGRYKLKKTQRTRTTV